MGTRNEKTHLTSVDTNAHAATNADSQILNSHQAFGALSSHDDNILISQVLDKERADQEAERILAQPDDGQTPLGIHVPIDSPAKKINPMFNDCVDSKAEDNDDNDDDQAAE